jgi:tetratricopeptide (TPR) repeat protein
LDEIKFQDYPSPIALAYDEMDKLLIENNPVIKHDLLKGLFEVILKYCSFILICQYIKDERKNEEINRYLLEDLPRPSLGDLNKILGKILEFYQSNNFESILPEMYDFYNMKKFLPASKVCRDFFQSIDIKLDAPMTVKIMFDLFIRYRNRLAHGGSITDREARNRIIFIKDALEEILGEMKFINKLKLAYVNKINVVNGFFKHIITYYNAPDKTREIVCTFDTYLNDQRLYLFSFEGGEIKPLLQLSPLIIYHYWDNSKKYHIFFFNGGSEKFPDYLNYELSYNFKPVDNDEHFIYIDDFRNFKSALSQKKNIEKETLTVEEERKRAEEKVTELENKLKEQEEERKKIEQLYRIWEEGLIKEQEEAQKRAKEEFRLKDADEEIRKKIEEDIITEGLFLEKVPSEFKCVYKKWFETSKDKDLLNIKWSKDSFSLKVNPEHKTILECHFDYLYLYLLIRSKAIGFGLTDKQYEEYVNKLVNIRAIADIVNTEKLSALKLSSIRPEELEIILNFTTEFVEKLKNPSGGSDKIENLLSEVDFLYNKGNYKEAIELCDKILEINPKSIRAWNIKGDSISDQEKYEEAIKCYDKALEINPEFIDPWNGKGLALYNLDNYEEAIKCYNKALEFKPEFFYALFNKGLALNNLSKYEEAIKCYDKALEFEPSDFDTWNNKGDIFYKLCKYEKAIESYNKALKTLSNNPDTWNSKGNSLYNLGNHKESIECYDKALEINPEFINSLNKKGSALCNLDRYKEAIECFNKALKINPSEIDTLNKKGEALYSLGKYHEAIECYDKALKINPSEIDTLNNIGEAFERLGNYGEAIKCYDKALEINPDHVDALFRKGYVFNIQGKREEAIKCYDKALATDPEKIYLWFNKGLALFSQAKTLHKKNKYDESIECFDKVLKIDPTYSYVIEKKKEILQVKERDKVFLLWDEIVENFLEFNKIVTDRDNDPYRIFGTFAHWYYLPEKELFAPGKFICYSGITLENYRKCLDYDNNKLELKDFLRV